MLAFTSSTPCSTQPPIASPLPTQFLSSHTAVFDNELIHNFNLHLGTSVFTKTLCIVSRSRSTKNYCRTWPEAALALVRATCRRPFLKLRWPRVWDEFVAFRTSPRMAGVFFPKVSVFMPPLELDLIILLRYLLSSLREHRLPSMFYSPWPVSFTVKRIKK